MRRIPHPQLIAAHWPLWAVCALFLLAGVLGLDDYGVTTTSPYHRIGEAALDYLAGDGERAFEQLLIPHDRYYGAVAEAPLALVERLRGVDGSSGFHPDRRVLQYLFFLAGGVFCYLLVLRMFGSRRLALIAVALFLLHPRIYADSFGFGPFRDVSFLVAFMVSLYLVHRAFRRDTLGAFLLCGVGVGLLVNLRIMGIVLFAAVLALRALDLGGGGGRRRVLLTAGAFALAAILAYYGSLPVLWTDPVGRFPELVRTLASHPNEEGNLFRGAVLSSTDGPPWDYVPVWVGITTPPATLLLALAGALALAWGGLRRPRRVLRNGPLRFGLLLVALPVVTLVAIVVLESTIYDDWRHLYFLYAPLLLLAIIGLRQLASIPRGRWFRAGAYALAGAAVAVTITSMIRIDPHLPNSFNFLVDRTTPERLNSLYPIEDRKRPRKALLSVIIRDHPSGAIFLSIGNAPLYLETLPAAHGARITETLDFRSGERNFYAIHARACSDPAPFTPISYNIRVYATTLLCVIDPAAWFGRYRREAQAAEPLLRSRFDVHRVGDVLVYLRDGCSPDDMDARFFLRVHPVAPADATHYGFENRDFPFTRHGARIDGNCVAVVPLPDYPIARIETGQFTPERALAALRAVASDEPRARSRFDVWLAADGRSLIYARDECATEDVEARFFIHAWPVDERDLLERRAEYGFNSLDFDFPEYGVRTGEGGCIATVPLPAYPIANIHTGQFGGEDTLWSARFALAPPEVEPAALAGEPLARSAFDVHRHGDALVYVRDGCTDEDAGTAFFLHLVPIDPGDLPDDRGQYGFDNLDFFLWERGARVGDRCVAVVPLPDYPIATVRTGQYDATGRLWTAEFALPGGE